MKLSIQKELQQIDAHIEGVYLLKYVPKLE